VATTSAPTPLERLADAVERIAVHVAGRPARGRTHDDADGVIGTIDCDDAVGFDPRPLLAALDRHGARVVVIGQVAGILHGSEELTGDLDLLWGGDARMAPKLAAAFADVHADVSDEHGKPVPLDAAAFELPKVLFRSPTASGDCCTIRLRWGDIDVVGIIERATTTHGDGTTVRYASSADLIAMRVAVGRPKDLRRVDELRRLLGC
jgi:hypothetical protein